MPTKTKICVKLTCLFIFCFQEENQRYALAHRCLDSLLKEGFDVDFECNDVEKKWMDVLLKMFAVSIIGKLLIFF